MSFERPSRGILVFQCDACTELLECDETGRSYGDCWAEAREQGWTTQKPVGYDWEHYCPECAKFSKQERVPRAEKIRRG